MPRLPKLPKLTPPSSTIPAPIPSPISSTSTSSRTQTQLGTQARSNTSTSPLDKRRRQPIDVARALVVRLLLAKSGPGAGTAGWDRAAAVELSYSFCSTQLRLHQTNVAPADHVYPSRSCYCAIKCSSGSCSRTA